MQGTMIAAGLLVLALLLQLAGAVSFGPVLWVILAVALASGVLVDVARHRTA